MAENFEHKIQFIIWNMLFLLVERLINTRVDLYPGGLNQEL